MADHGSMRYDALSKLWLGHSDKLGFVASDKDRNIVEHELRARGCMFIDVDDSFEAVINDGFEAFG